MVTDSAGKTVPGLQPWDLTVLDNDRPSKILSFHSYDGVAVKPEPPTEVILLVDTADLTGEQVTSVKAEVERFLRQNGEHQAQPTSIFQFATSGLRISAKPLADTRALVTILGQIKGDYSPLVNQAEFLDDLGSGRTVTLSTPLWSAQDRLNRLNSGMYAMTDIAENEARRPGRKLLVWIGPGWPVLDRTSSVYGFSKRDREIYFDAIVQLSTRIREARMEICNVVTPTSKDLPALILPNFKDYLQGVKSAQQTNINALGLQVLAIQSGGQVLTSNGDVASHVQRCVADADAFYTVSFNPPRAQSENEYHDLKVRTNRPELTVRSKSGYYNQP